MVDTTPDRLIGSSEHAGVFDGALRTRHAGPDGIPGADATPDGFGAFALYSGPHRSRACYANMTGHGAVLYLRRGRVYGAILEDSPDPAVRDPWPAR